jgi:hypothetical protein
VRQPAASKLECRIAAQMIEIVAIPIVARDGEDAGADHVGKTVHTITPPDAPLREHAAELLGHPTNAPVLRKMTDVRRPPSNAAAIFSRETAGAENSRIVSSTITKTIAIALQRVRDERGVGQDQIWLYCNRLFLDLSFALLALPLRCYLALPLALTFGGGFCRQ